MHLKILKSFYIILIDFFINRTEYCLICVKIFWKNVDIGQNRIKKKHLKLFNDKLL